MILKVNPTRINLLKLKKELKVAKRGHKLLKDKRDGLMKKFMAEIRDTKKLRKNMEERLGSAFKSYTYATAMIPKSIMDTALLLPNAEVSLGVNIKNIMSVKVPEFTIEKKGTALSYGFIDTTGDLDNAIMKFDKLFTDIINLAAKEKTIEKLAEEIEIVRRRVSALEFTRIPNIADTVKFITLQLEERSRDAVVATMRVKAMILAKEKDVVQSL